MMHSFIKRFYSRCAPVLFFQLLMSSMLRAQSDVPLHFQLLLDTNVLHVHLQYTPLESDSTTFIYGLPPFGGQIDIFDGIKNIYAEAPATLKVNPGKRTVTVYYKPGQLVSLTYDIIDTHTQKHGTRGELFRPMIMKDYFYGHGVNVFLAPQFRERDRKVKQSVQWKTVPQLPFFFGSDPSITGDQVSIATTESYQLAPITAAADLKIEKITLNKVNNYLVVRDSHLTEKEKDGVISFFRDYNKSLRKFWNDYDDKEFSLILEPFLKINHDISGIAYKSGFIGKYSGDTLLTPTKIFVISHEIDHHWVGHRLDFGSEQQWFNEGFNDYVAAYVLMNAKLMEKDWFENTFNKTLREHYTSPIRATPNDSIFKNYWKLGDYSRLPYRRGNIFAFFLDNIITIKFEGKKTIRNLLLDLYAFRRTKGEEYYLTQQDFISVASNYIPAYQMTNYIDRYINKGEPIVFTPTVMMNECKIFMVDDVPVLSITNAQKFRWHFEYGLK